MEIDSKRYREIMIIKRVKDNIELLNLFPECWKDNNIRKQFKDAQDVIYHGFRIGDIEKETCDRCMRLMDDMSKRLNEKIKNI